MSSHTSMNQNTTPQVRIGSVMFDIEFARVHSIQGGTITAIFESAQQVRLNRANARQVHFRKGEPTFLPGRVPWPKSKTKLVIEPKSGLWGYRTHYEDILKRKQGGRSVARAISNQVEQVTTDMNAPIPTSETERAQILEANANRARVDKFLERYKHIYSPGASPAELVPCRV